MAYFLLSIYSLNKQKKAILFRTINFNLNKKIFYHRNEKYEGNWENDKMNGHGTYRYENGDKYVGNFVNSTRSGKGTYYHKNGTKYEGNISN